MFASIQNCLRKYTLTIIVMRHVLHIPADLGREGYPTVPYQQDQWFASLDTSEILCSLAVVVVVSWSVRELSVFTHFIP